MKGLLHSIRITDDIVFNLFEDTNGNGAVGLSLRYTGDVPVIIEDGANEEFAPNQYFFVESETAIVNTAFRISFKKEAGKRPEAIMRYIVPQHL